MLLVIGLVALGPLRAIGETYQSVAETERLYPVLLNDGPWRTFVRLSWLTIGAACALSIYTGIRLIRGSTPEDVGFAKMALWIIGPIPAIVIRFGIQPALFGWSTSANEMGEFAGIMIASVIWAGVWNLYLSKSGRVRNTYNIPVDSLERRPSKFRVSSLWSVSNVSSEGVRRLCVVVNVLGVIWAVIFLVVAGSALTRGQTYEGALFTLLGLVGFGAARALTWVVAGFVSKPRSSI
ncbi:hypothetical protein PSP31120_01292 [Pandoraea sputorum]|nr:hypothetical protein PSP31120_01292 [Pandoraea sputorum]